MVTTIHPRHTSRQMEREHRKIASRYAPSARELFADRDYARRVRLATVRSQAAKIQLSPMQREARAYLLVHGGHVAEGSESRYVRQLADKGVAHVVNGTWQLTEVGRAVEL